MKFLLTRAKSFHQPGGRRGASESIVTLNPGEVDAPEWIRETNTYRAGVADGSIRDFAPKAPGFFLPTKAQLIEKGYAPDVADEIIARQKELSEQFTKDEPVEAPTPKAPLINPNELGLSSGAPETVPLSKAQVKAAAKEAKVMAHQSLATT
jgi:hypothetical protein